MVNTVSDIVPRCGRRDGIRMRVTETVWRIWKARTNSSPGDLRMGGALRRLLGKGAVRRLHVGDGSSTR
jgi:hypothetical protein